MNDRIRALREYIREGRHHGLRQDIEIPVDWEGLSPIERTTRRLNAVLAAEKPVLLPGERIVFTRTVRRLPPLFTPGEWDAIRADHYIHEQGQVCNICPNYAETIAEGLLSRREKAAARLDAARREEDKEGEVFLRCVLRSIDAVLCLTRRYRDAALAAGRGDIAALLARVPAYGARTFHEALQSFRILHFTLWCEGEYHNTIGRFDQYMMPYLAADLADGRLTPEGAFELLLEFFLTFNRDSDLYPGIQQGDNGQSMMLGGTDAAGRCAFNALSRMCLRASLELKLIDPKINLRVSRDTPDEIYRLGTELTREGLGFPQYSGDDTVIPGLIALGYDPADAADYTVAACWEFIIPGRGMDVPNIEALSFAGAVASAVGRDLTGCADFDALMDRVRAQITARCRALAQSVNGLWMIPAPFMSVLMDGCIERARDISLGSRYNNYGIHGTGLSTAVDALSAVRKFVFEERAISADALVRMLDADFEGDERTRQRLLAGTPRFGQGDPATDALAETLLECFADALEPLRNDRGGRFRAGTGSAMYYLWHGGKVGATPDGRKAGAPLSCNYSPSLEARHPDPLSIIRSFTRPPLERVVNGGPLTLELDAGLFTDADAIGKVAMLVKSFFDMGGHQLQLNAVSRDRLLEAQRNPDEYRGLIVRVWGWSAYFVELDREYQDHVISRTELRV
ncbi:MAG: pyruvate formate lyase family protein [Christensenellales bacterium]|jgi:pyruvate-formate lyase